MVGEVVVIESETKDEQEMEKTDQLAFLCVFSNAQFLSVIACCARSHV